MTSPGDDAPAADADAKRVVAAGYDIVARRYLEWSGLRPSATRLRALRAALDRIPPGGDILELGCGAGLPMTAALAEKGRVTGVDISGAQIQLARANVPTATFVQGDMTTLELAPSTFDAVVAFYSITHVPRDEHAALLGRITSWLRPAGVFVASMGVEDDPGGVERDWLGVDMYFSHFSAKRNRRLVEAAGMEIESADVLAEPGDRHDARFLWVVARKPETPAPATPD
ncbi:MAG TPA: class I SAM-dependent methyltransferase [Candidatus Limnocylindrales bacterium]|nr:class I SAM-dependent methyltransferase [Candidatus Limnocylindrales bacterium]